MGCRSRCNRAPIDRQQFLSRTVHRSTSDRSLDDAQRKRRRGTPCVPAKTGELIDIKEAPQLTTRLNAARARVKALKLRLQLETAPIELVVNEDDGEPYNGSTYRHWVPTARAVAVFGFPARDTVREAIVRAERLTTELTGSNFRYARKA